MNNNKTSTIVCPACSAPITIDINQLLAGRRFNCPNSNAAIGMSNNGKAQILSK